MSVGDLPRVHRPQRSQVEFHDAALDDLVPEDHPVRSIWALVSKLDLSSLYKAIKARGSSPGRAATDPAVLLALWVLATSEGVGSARHLERLCDRDIIYRWVCGGVSVNHHTLADFRALKGNVFDNLLSQTVGLAMKAGIITLRSVAQDGTRVRASAGAASFRREKTLKECLAEAEAEIRELKKDLLEDGSGSTARQRAARERAAREKVEAIENALKELPDLEETRARALKADRKYAEGKAEVRASTTDPDARNMKMPDGGFRPGFNIQFATDVDGGCIVGAFVTNRGADARQLEEMLADILNRTGRLPPEFLADGGYSSRANIDGLVGAGIDPYIPPRGPRKEGQSPYQPKWGDSPAVVEWRAKMATDEAKEKYKKRSPTAERVNAELKGRFDLDSVNVRGLAKVTSVALLAGVTFNLLRLISLG